MAGAGSKVRLGFDELTIIPDTDGTGRGAGVRPAG
jgi:hypothetical protein